MSSRRGVVMVVVESVVSLMVAELQVVESVVQVGLLQCLFGVVVIVLQMSLLHWG